MPLIVETSQPDDPRLAHYRDMRERDLAGREGIFIAEGEVVVRRLLAQRRFPVVSVFLAEKRLAGLEDALAGLPAETPVFVAPQAAMDRIAGFPMHRGILAVGTRSPLPDAGAMLAGLPERALILVLSAIANHDNMGGLFRNAAAFGADAVLLDSDCCDPLYRKAIRVSVGGVFEVPFARLNADVDVPALLEAHDFAALALTPRGEKTLADIAPRPRTAALFGAEGPGLPDAILARCETVRIPMAAGFDSLNVATASGIVLSRLREAPA